MKYYFIVKRICDFSNNGAEIGQPDNEVKMVVVGCFWVLVPCPNIDIELGIVEDEVLKYCEVGLAANCKP